MYLKSAGGKRLRFLLNAFHLFLSTVRFKNLGFEFVCCVSLLFIAAPKCSVKPLSKAVAAIFKQIFYQVEQYNKKSFFYSGVKTFWVIQNNKPVMDSINRINAKRKAKSISTFDFSTLYTKIPHNKLIKVMNEMVDFCFQGDSHKVLAVSKSGCRWVYSSPKGSTIFSKKTTKLAIKYLMDNCYFACGGQLFRQKIGIPMGSDPAPFMANLFLYHFESKWLKDRSSQRICSVKNVFVFSRSKSNICDLLSSSEQIIFPGGSQLFQKALIFCLRTDHFSRKLPILTESS